MQARKQEATPTPASAVVSQQVTPVVFTHYYYSLVTSPEHAESPPRIPRARWAAHDTALERQRALRCVPSSWRELVVPRCRRTRGARECIPNIYNPFPARPKSETKGNPRLSPHTLTSPPPAGSSDTPAGVGGGRSAFASSSFSFAGSGGSCAQPGIACSLRGEGHGVRGLGPAARGLRERGRHAARRRASQRVGGASPLADVLDVVAEHPEELRVLRDVRGAHVLRERGAPGRAERGGFQNRRSAQSAMGGRQGPCARRVASRLADLLHQGEIVVEHLAWKREGAGVGV